MEVGIYLVNIARLFNDEVKDKKRTASGVHHKTGKRGYVGKLYFTSDLLKGKEKREYQGTGKVIRSNMYDTILPFNEFEALTAEDQKQHLVQYRKRYSSKEIIKAWGIGQYQFYKLIDSLGIPKENRKPNKPKSKQKREGKVAADLPTIKEKVEEMQQPVVEIIERREKENGMTLSLNGEYTAEELVRKLEKFGIILSDEPVDFKVEIRISELK